MPPGPKLPEETRAAFRTWINAGAPFVEVQEAGFEWGKFEKDDLWAFSPLQYVTPPETDDVESAVDAFIQRKLRERSLEPGPAADRRTLIRRATIDLTGLLPTPNEVDAFIDDPAPDREAFVSRFCQLPNADPEALRGFFATQHRVADALWKLFDDPTLLPPLSGRSVFRHLGRTFSYGPVLRWMGRPLSEVVAQHDPVVPQGVLEQPGHDDR